MNKANQISKSRQKVLSISKTIADLSNKVLSTKIMTKGTVYNQKKKCGNINCKCFDGKFYHTTKLLSFSHYGKTVLIPLTKYTMFELARIEKQVRDYQQFRRIRAEIICYFKLLIAEINKLEKNLLTEVDSKKGDQRE